MVLAAIAQVLLAYGQVREAKNERVSASRALERAEQAEASVGRAQQQLDMLSAEAERNVAYIRKIAEQVDTGRQEIEIFRLDATKQISNVTAAATTLDNEIERVRKKADFADMIVRAQNDDRWAYELFYKSYTNITYELKEAAESASAHIIEQVVECMYDVSSMLDAAETTNTAVKIPSYLPPFDEPVEKINMIKFMDAWNKTYSSDRPYMLVLLWTRCEAISEHTKLQFIVNTIALTPNTRILIAACTILDRKANLNYGGDPDHAADYLKWWNTARKAYPEDEVLRATRYKIFLEWYKQHPGDISNKTPNIPFEFVTNIIADINQERKLPTLSADSSNETVTNSQPASQSK